MAQKVKVEPDMATYWFSAVMYKYLITKLPCAIYLCVPSNSTDLKNRSKTAQKVKVEPDMATYWFSTVMYKYLISN